MNTAAEIKSKEDSLAALMTKILKDPLAPIAKSIEQLNEAILDANDQIEEIQASVTANGNYVENIEKALRRTFASIKDEALPDQTNSLTQYISSQTNTGTQKVLTSINDQSNSNRTYINQISGELLGAISSITDRQSELTQSFHSIKVLLGTIHETSAGEIRASRELSQRAAETLANQCDASTQLFIANLHNASNVISNTLSEQNRLSEIANQSMIHSLESIYQVQSELRQSVNELSTQIESSERKILVQMGDVSLVFQTQLKDIQQSEKFNLSSIESNKTVLTHLLTQQNTDLVSQVTNSHKKLKNLAIITSIFFFFMMCYVGYDIWNNLN